MKLPQIVSLEKNKSIVLRNASCVLSMNSKDPQNQLGLLRNQNISIKNGVIEKISAEEITVTDSNTMQFDSKNHVVMPGLIDAHTHPIYAGNRAKETVLKAKGASYEDIAAAGGGIRASMQAARLAKNEELKKQFENNARRALERGVVVLESKTGYGLNVEQETRLYSLLLEGAGEVAPWISPTLLPLHAASPDTKTLDEYVEDCVKALPQWQKITLEKSNPKVLPACVDIFIEKNYFSNEHGRIWLESALKAGFNAHIHADEFSLCGGAEIAIELAKKYHSQKLGRILSVDHGQFITQKQLEELGNNNVCAIALPLTSFFSKIAYVDGKMWEKSGVPIAIASDFNPGSAPLNSLWMACFLGLTQCGFSLETCLKSVTLNAAKALSIEQQFGSIEIGKKATIIAFEGSSPEDFFASPIGDHLKLVLI